MKEEKVGVKKIIGSGLKFSKENKRNNMKMLQSLVY